MQFKTVPLVSLEPPLAADADAGDFTALVAVFGNVDNQGERILPGAFKGTLERWAASGAPIPVLWSHQWMDPDLHIGQVLDAQETEEGLQVRGHLDVAENAKAARVRQLMVQRRVNQFSFAYDVLDGAAAEDGAMDLKELELYEVGPCLVGANPLTELLAAKAGNVGAPPGAAPRPGDPPATVLPRGSSGLVLRLRLAGLSAPEERPG